jgi:hypothetical protein
MPSFKIPLDAYILAIPITYACTAFTGLIFKTVYMDPETSTMQKYESISEEVLKEEGLRWNDGVAQMFRERIKKNKFSVFGSNFFGDKQ